MSQIPLAIVGCGCVLPGAFSLEELWAAVLARKVAIDDPPGGPLLSGRPTPWSDRGGYVRGFAERFAPEGFRIPPRQILSLDPFVQWLLQAGREALHAACPTRGPLPRTGVVVGNLVLPSRSLSRFGESVWLEGQSSAFWRSAAPTPRPDPRNRFQAGLPAQLLAEALGLEAGGFALDAACASSLYALKLAGDWLADGRADLMLAGGVNGTDPVALRYGFHTLRASSPAGRSLPLRAGADGLVPAEGAVLFALRRLEDAERSGDAILGVIRGVGLSNDGGGRGLLTPSAAGQVLAMRAAYAAAGLSPADIAYVECHATGTQVGDATEVASLAEVFGPQTPLYIGSLKANLGHLMTASGAAGLVKVLGALRAGLLPPQPEGGPALPALERTGFRLPAEPVPWEGPRRAAVSSFGFGGNNAHLVVEQWQPQRSPRARRQRPPVAEPVAIVGLGLVADGAGDAPAFAHRLFGPAGEPAPPMAGLSLPAAQLRFPPRDLAETLPLQLAVLQAALEAVREAGPLPPSGTGVFIGAGCDGEIGRGHARSRVEEWVGAEAPEAWLAAVRERVAPPGSPANVLGTLANLAANRLSHHWNLTAPSFTVCAEELSGIAGLEIAARSLGRGELDAALVGAVDLSREPVHLAAAEALLPPERRSPGDAAAVLVLKRLADARRDGNRIYALVDSAAEDGAPALVVGEGCDSVTPRFGHAHAASGLLQVVAGALSCRHALMPDPVDAARPWLAGERRAQVRLRGLGGGGASVGLRAEAGVAAEPAPVQAEPVQLHVFGGADRADVLEALSSGRTADADGPARLVLVAQGAAELARRQQEALSALSGGLPPVLGPDIHFADAPIGGDVAAVFGGAAAAYPAAGRDLLLGFPWLLAPGFAAAPESAWGLGADGCSSPDPLPRLAASALLCQAHAAFSRHVLALPLRRAVGLSSGETNAVAALGAWNDLPGLLADLRRHRLYAEELGGAFAAVRRAWGLPGDAPVRWENWRLLHPAPRVLEALAGEARAHLTAVHAPGDCAIGGEAEACARVIARLGGRGAIPLGYDLAVHCPVMAEVADTWRTVHERPTVPQPDARIFGATEIVPTDAATIADALMAMAVAPADLPRAVEAAHAAGVRVFIEHGPRDLCTGWIGQILEGRPHLAVALDRQGQPALRTAARAVAALVAAGVACDWQGLNSRLRACALPAPAEPAPALQRIPAHPPAMILPAPPATGSTAPQAGVPASVTASRALGRAGVTQPPAASAAPPTARLAAAAGNPAVMEAVAAIVAHQGRVTALHQGHLGRQAGLHRAFAEFQQRLWAGASAAAVPPAALPPPAAPLVPARRRFSREQLEQLASGRISDVFGPAFRPLDGHRRRVRLPMPPLLLVDRVVALEGEPLGMGSGVIETETDIPPGAWYLENGQMPLGLMIEAGQADLLLISWLGIDAHNRGERVYRLLGCEATLHGPLPVPGETLHYRIEIERHARQGEVRLFFFRFDCRDGEGRLRLSVRNGQAGFFSDAELAAARGVAWDPRTAEHSTTGTLDPPVVRCRRETFPEEAVAALASGRAGACFGPGFEMARAHVRSPRIPEGRLRLIDRVTELRPEGGPWGRGYLRAETDIHADDWFFPCHFRDDPVMPGTLMLQACLQAMAFYLGGTGHTLAHDGWRFQPLQGEPWPMVCRGQIVPSSRRMVCEVFVQELLAGPLPTLRADVLVSVDGRRAFHCRRLGLQLVPDWPLGPERMPAGRPGSEVVVDGVRQDENAMLACAWGAPSAAFGPAYSAFDGPRRLPRLPGPPYLFISRVVEVQGTAGSPQVGAAVEAEYDLPGQAWYFDPADGGTGMPFAVLLEVVLQPCGWLTAFLGIPLTSTSDLAFRNLDGCGVVRRALGPGAGTLRTRIRLKEIARVGATLIETFEFDCRLADEVVFSGETVFGHFPHADLAGQVGLAPTPGERLALHAAANADLPLEGQPFQPDGRLRLLDRVTGCWPQGDGRLRLRAEKRISGEEWYFRAHFFQDPVQPGSLGLEAMLQALRFALVRAGLLEGLRAPRLEVPALQQPIRWKYRGQVLPTDTLVTVTAELTPGSRRGGVVEASADAALWVGERLIYRLQGLAVRAVEGAPLSPPPPGPDDDATEVLDPARDTWLNDHRPTHTTPVLPFTFAVDRMAAAARRHFPGHVVVGVEEAEIRHWIRCAGPSRLRVRTLRLAAAEGRADVLLETAGADQPWQPVATARVRLAPSYPQPPAGEGIPPLGGAHPGPDPYADGRLFHGPALQLARDLVVGDGGSSIVLDASAPGLPRGCLHPALLDAATHAIDQDGIEAWIPEAVADTVAYPRRITGLRVYGPSPEAGVLRCEVRADGLDAGNPRLPAMRVWILDGERLWVSFRLVEVLLPKGPLGRIPRALRTAFMRDRLPVPGVGLARAEGEVTVLEQSDVAGSDWLPGTVAGLYGAMGPNGLPARGADLLRQVAVKDHVARRQAVHPRTVEVAPDGRVACAALPLNAFPLRVRVLPGRVEVVDAGPGGIDVAGLSARARSELGTQPSLGEDILLGLLGRFVSALRQVQPLRLAALGGQARLYLGNHQTLIESTLFSLAAGIADRRQVLALAKDEVRGMRLGELLGHLGSRPGSTLAAAVSYVDQADPRSFLPVLRQLGAWLQSGGSALVHVEGIRARQAGRPVARMSAALLDLASAGRAAIVPIRFVGGLPLQPLAVRTDLPVGYGRQEYLVGAPLQPEELAELSPGERVPRVLAAINALGPGPGEEQPAAPDPDFAAAVSAWSARSGADPVYAAIWATLAELPEPSPETQRLLDAAQTGCLRLAAGNPDDRWPEGLAKRLFGSRGPRVELV